MKKHPESKIDFREKLITFAQSSIEELHTNLDDGLNDAEVAKRHEYYGYNTIENYNKTTWGSRLWGSFMTPFNSILFAIIGISFFTDYYFVSADEKDLTSVIVIGIMVFLSGILDFIQNIKSDKACEKLKNMIKTTTTVLRNGRHEEVVLKDVVPGDIVVLSAGSIIPADMRILYAKDLFVSQSALTGESAPVEKEIHNSESQNNPLDFTNLGFMGTNVISGSGTGIVVSIGDETYFGSLVDSLAHGKIETSFDKGIKNITAMLVKLIVLSVVAIFFINGFFKGDWLQSLIFAVSVAISLTPEMLPVIVATNLAKGAIIMSRKKTVVKNLSSIQNFGAMDIFCTDKTGTLTEDKVALEFHLNVRGEEDERVFKHAYLNSYFQTGLKNLLDIAILEHKNSDYRATCGELCKNYHLIDEIPFDFNRKRMSVVLRKNTGKIELITKGAVDDMLLACNFVEYEGAVEPLTQELKNEVLERMSKLNYQGMRVIGVAHSTHFEKDKTTFTVDDEKSMVFIGFIAFLDPPKESAAEAIKDLYRYGILVKVLTGDNDLVTKYICEKVGIISNNILLGSEIENITDEKLKEVAKDIDIFAKLTPHHKSRIINALRDDGHVIGFMGDGINDAPAMKKSDVAISVDTAVDIAKESADIILLQKDLRILKDGVLEGRKIFGNIIKYIKMTTSYNFGTMLSILLACILLPFLPLLPLQMLILNLFYDFSQTVIPWDNIDDEYLEKQKKWDITSIKRFIIWLSPVNLIFNLLMSLVLFFILKYNNIQMSKMFHTGIFVFILITQTCMIHFVRSEKIPFIQSIASKYVLCMTILLVAIALVLPFTNIGWYIKLSALSIEYYVWLVVILIGYAGMIGIVKREYKKRYKNWL